MNTACLQELVVVVKDYIFHLDIWEFRGCDWYIISC